GDSRRGFGLPHPARALTRHIRSRRYDPRKSSDGAGLKQENTSGGCGVSGRDPGGLRPGWPKRKTAWDAKGFAFSPCVTHFHRSVRPTSIASKAVLGEDVDLLEKGLGCTLPE